MKNKKESGYTLTGFIFVVALVLYFSTILIKTIPSYVENFSVQSSLTSIANEFNEKKIKPKDIKTKLLARLNNNNVTRIKSDNIEISDNNENGILRIKYEVRIPFFRNIDFVIAFDESEAIDL